MDKKHLTEMMDGLVEAGLLTEDRPAVLGAMMFEILLLHWDGIDERASGILLAIAGVLKKDATRTLAEAKAAMLLAKMQGKIPSLLIDGKETILTDHELTFQVSCDKQSGKWIGTCYAIGMTVIADDPAALQQRCIEQVGEKAIQSGVVKTTETLVISFKEV